MNLLFVFILYNVCLADGVPRILKNLYRLYDNLNRSNLLLTDRIEYEKMSKDPKYTDLGTIGSISPEEDPMCPELLPIYCIYSPLQRSHYYITDELLLKVRLSEGYENKGIIGYAAPGYGACDAFTRIYEFYSPYSGVIQFADLEWAEKFMRGQGGHAYQANILHSRFRDANGGQTYMVVNLVGLTILLAIFAVGLNDLFIIHLYKNASYLCIP